MLTFDFLRVVLSDSVIPIVGQVTIRDSLSDVGNETLDVDGSVGIVLGDEGRVLGGCCFVNGGETEHTVDNLGEVRGELVTA